MIFNKQDKLVITRKDPTLAQVCNNSTLQRQDLESHHKEDVIIYHSAPTASSAGVDSHIKDICDATNVVILLIYFCI